MITRKAVRPGTTHKSVSSSFNPKAIKKSNIIKAVNLNIEILITALIPLLDESGNPLLDENGNPLYGE